MKHNYMGPDDVGFLGPLSSHRSECCPKPFWTRCFFQTALSLALSFNAPKKHSLECMMEGCVLVWLVWTWSFVVPHHLYYSTAWLNRCCVFCGRLKVLTLWRSHTLFNRSCTLSSSKLSDTPDGSLLSRCFWLFFFFPFAVSVPLRRAPAVT